MRCAGPVSDVEVVRERDGSHRGFAFVTFQASAGSNFDFGSFFSESVPVFASMSRLLPRRFDGWLPSANRWIPGLLLLFASGQEARGHAEEAAPHQHRECAHGSQTLRATEVSFSRVTHP